MKSIAIAVVAFLTLAIFSGIVSAEYNNKNKLTLDMKQSVSGDGYFMNYKYARMPNVLGLTNNTNGVEFKDYSHGSGQIDTEALLTAESSDEKNGIIEDYGYDHWEALSCIQFKETNNAVYRPMALGIGTGYYAANPIQYNSLIKEKTWLKNRGSDTSMHHEVEYAHALNKNLDVAVKDFISEDDPSISVMNISEDVTNGRAHIGLLQGDTDLITAEDEYENLYITDFARKKPLIDLDEDYLGNFHIEKQMNVTLSIDEVEEDDDWLPCCSGSFLSLPDVYKKGSKGFGSDVSGIFDCTCFKVPAQAEFTRIY